MLNVSTFPKSNPHSRTSVRYPCHAYELCQKHLHLHCPIIVALISQASCSDQKEDFMVDRSGCRFTESFQGPRSSNFFVHSSMTSTPSGHRKLDSRSSSARSSSTMMLVSPNTFLRLRSFSEIEPTDNNLVSSFPPKQGLGKTDKAKRISPTAKGLQIHPSSSHTQVKL